MVAESQNQPNGLTVATFAPPRSSSDMPDPHGRQYLVHSPYYQHRLFVSSWGRWWEVVSYGDLATLALTGELRRLQRCFRLGSTSTRSCRHPLDLEIIGGQTERSADMALWKGSDVDGESVDDWAAPCECKPESAHPNGGQARDQRVVSNSDELTRLDVQSVARVLQMWRQVGPGDGGWEHERETSLYGISCSASHVHENV
ncbi:hypothetical protein OH76DRAFT_245346 [Lentinus brumalis]|uniref:Uncharacterized protein n=1 Tax=Lentinus brumalis TaxID=2498619 RepID=A0A371CLT1_9APHY|nr:hypothetical protein OH76DRAFT_245346 [Polyporus brumalis]